MHQLLLKTPGSAIWFRTLGVRAERDFFLALGSNRPLCRRARWNLSACTKTLVREPLQDALSSTSKGNRFRLAKTSGSVLIPRCPPTYQELTGKASAALPKKLLFAKGTDGLDARRPVGRKDIRQDANGNQEQSNRREGERVCGTNPEHKRGNQTAEREGRRKTDNNAEQDRLHTVANN